MKREITVFAVLLVFLTTVGLSQVSSMPQYYYAVEGDQHAAWVAAESALDANGEPDSFLFSESAVRAIKKYQERQPLEEGACLHLGEFYAPEVVDVGDGDHHKYLARDFATTAKSVDWMFEGVVTGSTHGFNGPIPVTLFQVQTEEILKGPRDKHGQYFFLFPVAEFSVGNLKLCKTDQRYPALPEIGDRVILMAHLHLRNSREFLWIHDNIIVLKQDGTVSLPKKFSHLWSHQVEIHSSRGAGERMF